MNAQVQTVLTKQQVKTFGPRPIDGYGQGATITASVRYDDQCGNGHNTFSITAEVRVPHRRDIEAGGCMHDEIAKAFPVLAPLIKWHLVSADGPHAYVENTLYFAGDRDCWGLRQGEQRQIRNGKTGQLAWKRGGIETEYHDGDSPPDAAPLTVQWEPWMKTGEGKARELDNARSAAVWPDASDAELTQEPEALKAVLLARLPALMADFRAAVESCGFTY